MRTVAFFAVALTACPSGGAKNRPPDHSIEDFECKERHAEYSVAGGILKKAGVTVTCEGNRLRIEKWRAADDNRQSSSHSLTPGEFEAFWKKVENIGWRNLSDCENPAAEDDDPVYTFEIADAEGFQTLICAGKQLPFPFDRLLNQFDLTAAGYND